MDKFLNIEPEELIFPFELKKQVSCSIQLSNNTQNHVAFKVMTTRPDKCCVRPNTGLVFRGSSCYVTVTIVGIKEAPPNMQCEDKFLIKSAISSPGASTVYNQALLNSRVGDLVQECRLGVTYKLLDVQPSELQFPFELKKQSSCLLKLSNITENHVGFKVKTTDPKKYCVRPNMGTLLPRSTCDVIVTMQAPSNMPLDMQCKDKFLIQSIIASPSETFTPELFETGRVVEELKLRVMYYFPPRPQSPVSQIPGSDASLDALKLPQTNSNNTEVQQGLDQNENRVGDLFMKGITIGMVGLILGYLVMKMLPRIWSLTFVITMFVRKMINSFVSDKVDDWIVKSVLAISIHILTFLFGRNWKFGL